LIRDALSLTNAVGVDQTLTANETTDCLRALNDLIEDWSTQSLAVYGLSNQTFNTIIGTATYTIGSGANWVTNRPVRINGDAYSTVSGVAVPCVSVTQDEYDAIQIKAQTQEYPDCFLFVNEYPLGLVTLWPVPSAVTPVTFSMDMLLNSVPAAATVLQFPPGYMKAFKYALGVELAPVFGKKIENYPKIIDIANTSFANIKRANSDNKKRLMRVAPEYSDTSWETG